MRTNILVQIVGSNKMKSLQEKLDEVAKELEPILWDLLNEIEEK